MNPDLSLAAVQRFILEHETADEKELVLKHKSILGLPTALIAQQISGRKKAKDKLPDYYHTHGIIYPPNLNLEQSSSEKTALFKSEVLRSLDTDHTTILDLTGGLGVDCFYFSKVFDNVIYTDPNESLLALAKHNHLQLGASHISHHALTAAEFLKTTNTRADVIFLDPSRRTASNQKVFKLSDCEPDVTELQSIIFTKTDYLLLKASPLLDLQQALKELTNVFRIFVLAVDNECKELLFLCRRDYSGEPRITAVNLHHQARADFSFTLPEEKEASLFYSTPKQYLYEPNSAILKAGAFKKIASSFALEKLHPNTHLYTSNSVNLDFPGRIFRMDAKLKSDPKIIAEHFPEKKANIITRNYPLRVDELKKKLKLTEGGDQFLIAASTEKERILCAATRIK